MAFIRKLFWFMRPLRKAVRVKRGYSEEVLYAGWVDTSPLQPPKKRR